MTKTQRLFQATIMAIFMSLFMSLFMAIMNVGFGERLLFAWLRGWGYSFIVAWPLSVLLPYPIQKLIKVLRIK